MEIRTVSSFLDYFEKIRRRTLRVARCIPADLLEWTYAPGKFTFGDVLRHLAAIERFMYAETVSGRPSRYPGHGPDLADGHEAVFRYLDTLHQESMTLFAQLSDADLQRRCTTPAGIEITTWKWLRAMVEHEVHHRGQLYLMLGLRGIATPPLFGLTSEEVRERSSGFWILDFGFWIGIRRK